MATWGKRILQNLMHHQVKTHSWWVFASAVAPEEIMANFEEVEMRIAVASEKFLPRNQHVLTNKLHDDPITICRWRRREWIPRA